MYSLIVTTILWMGVVLLSVTMSLLDRNLASILAAHPLDYASRNEGLEQASPIVIEDNVWIGAHVAVMPGVTIGEGSVIAAGSTVTRDIPANSLAMGSPAKVIRTIDQDDQIRNKLK